MRGCRCYGILTKVQAAFADRVLGWTKLGAGRPVILSVSAVCDNCGKVWELEFRLNLQATVARRLALDPP